MPMTVARKCPLCGATWPQDAPSGHCPACLFKLGLTPVGGQSDLTEEDSNSGLARPGSLGDYELLELLGQGGMGAVYRARQKNLNRLVAIKLMLGAESASPRALARFHLEAQAAARLDHPHIVPIFESGETHSQPWFSMKLVEGGSLARRRPGKPGSPALALSELCQSSRILAQVAHAVHYAHQHGILHRDLNPANILLDHADTPYLTDFGIAKLFQPGVDLTRTVELLGTPGYLAPEQAAGKPASVATEVYSLGAILYELLTGQRPCAASTPVETLRKLVEEPPAAPRTLNPVVPRDLETICLRCLEKEPTRRYPSALALAEDLERFLRKEPITARRAGCCQKLWGWGRRKPALAGTLTALFCVIGLGLGGVCWQWHSAKTRTSVERQQLDRLQLERADDFFTAGDTATGLAWLARVLQRDPANPAASYRLVMELTCRNFPLPLAEFTSIRGAAWSPDGQWLLPQTRDPTLRVWDPGSGRPLNHPAALRSGTPTGALTPDGRWLATSEGSTVRLGEMATGDRLLTLSGDGVARVWDILPGQILPITFSAEQGIERAEFSPDGKWVVTAGQAGWARVWDSFSARALSPQLRHQQAVLWTEFSPNGQCLATSSQDHTARIWNVPTGHPLSAPLSHQDWVTCIRFSPDGRRVATGSRDRTARVWGADTGSPLTPPLVHEMAVRWVAFSPDSQKLLTASLDGTVRVWDAVSGKVLLAASSLHGSYIPPPDFSRDGRRILTVSEDGLARFWDAHNGQFLGPVLPQVGRVSAVCWNRQETLIATVSPESIARVWDLATGQIQMTTSRHTRRVVEVLQFTPDAQWLATATADATVRVWDVQTGLLCAELPKHASPIRSLQFSPDGRRLLTVTAEAARIWELPHLPVPAPGWLARLAEAVGGRRLNARHHLEPVPLQELFEIRRQLQLSQSTDPYTRWGNWFFADRSTRSSTPTP